MSTNQYGLDNDYFERKIAILHRDGLRNWTQAELARELARMSRTADNTVMYEYEFCGEIIDEKKSMIYSLRKDLQESGDVIREMNDELVDLRARLAEAQEVLRDCIEVGELDAETQWKAERVSKGRRVYVDDRALSASSEPSAPVERDERAEFEKFAEHPGHFNITKSDDEYILRSTQCAWTGWRARAKLGEKS